MTVNFQILHMSFSALMQYRIHVDISTSTRPICTKITGNTYQPISNHTRKFELNRISGSIEFDVDLDVVVLNNNSLFDSTSSRPICTKITGNTYQLISNHSRKFELNRISESVEFDVDLDVVALNNSSLFRVLFWAMTSKSTSNSMLPDIGFDSNLCEWLKTSS